MSVNETAITIQLSNYLPAREGWGRQAGTVVRQKLQAHVEARPGAGLVRISMQSVKRVDVAFASAAIVSFVEHYHGTRPMCLVHLVDADLIENLAAAAERMKVPVTAWNAQGVQVLGTPLGSALHDALAFALARPQGVRAAEFAVATGVSIANASSRFKRLWERGVLLRTEGSASSGGPEFVYRPIG